MAFQNTIPEKVVEPDYALLLKTTGYPIDTQNQHSLNAMKKMLFCATNKLKRTPSEPWERALSSVCGNWRLRDSEIINLDWYIGYHTSSVFDKDVSPRQVVKVISNIRTMIEKLEERSNI